MKQRVVSILAMCTALIAAAAQAQPSYPVKPVRVIVTTVPGPLDTFARIICDKMSTALKQPFVIENKPGAGGNIGADLVAKSPADGYTLLFALDTTFTVNPSIYKTMPFDPVKDFSVIAVPVTYGQMLAVNAALPAKNIPELVALAKQKPLSYASGGNGSPSHLSFAYFLATSGVEMNHIPYKGTGQSIVDVVAGQVDSIFAVTTGVYPHVKSGKLRALAVSSAKRSELAPEVPTVAESGFPGFEALNWYAFVAPGKTPTPILDRWNAEIVKVLKDASIREALTKHGLTPHPTTRAELTDFMKKESNKWGAIVRERKITAE